MDTAAPAAANASAIERPIPLLPPVTTVRLPFKLICINASSSLWKHGMAGASLPVGYGEAASTRTGERDDRRRRERHLALGRKANGGQLRSAECWHDLLGDALELLEHHRLW